MKVITSISSLAFLLCISHGSAHAQTGDLTDFGRIKYSATPQGYDSLLMELNSRNAVESYKRYVNEFINFDPASVDMSGALSDEIYEKRLKMMATEIQLPYNEVVKSYITVYTSTKSAMMERVLGLAQHYFPMIEEALYRHNLPMELKMLPVIESALIPRAESSASAVGLWQFMLRTGKAYGLEVNSFVDERCDPVKSTEAACLFLKDLYKMYGDWTLVIAAYNCGPGNVNKALKRVTNADSYWDIYDYLPRETRGYLPAFIASSYAYTYHKAHRLNPIPPGYPIATDTVKINRMLHLEQVASTLGIPIEILEKLNPQYRINIIPAVGNDYTLTLPQSAVGTFIDREREIYGKDTLYLAKYLNISNLSSGSVNSTGGARQSGASSSATGSKVTYKVKKGDTLGAIAKRYNTTVANIMKWNNIKSAQSVQIGKTLTINR